MVPVRSAGSVGFCICLRAYDDAVTDHDTTNSVGRTARLPSQPAGRRGKRLARRWPRRASGPASPASRARPDGRTGPRLGRLPAARRRSRPGGDSSRRRTWPPSSPSAVGVESETVALEYRPRRSPVARRERHDAVRPGAGLSPRPAGAALEASSRSGKPPVPGTRRRTHNCAGLGGGRRSLPARTGSGRSSRPAIGSAVCTP